MTFQKPWRAALLSVCGRLCDSVWVEKAQGHISGPIPIRELHVSQTTLWWGESEGSADEKEVTGGRNGSSQQRRQEQPCVVCICITRAKSLPDRWLPWKQSASSSYLWGPAHYLNCNSDPHKAGINGHQRISDGCGLLWINQETEYDDILKRAVIIKYFGIQPLTHHFHHSPASLSVPIETDRVEFHVRLPGVCCFRQLCEVFALI